MGRSVDDLLRLLRKISTCAVGRQELGPGPADVVGAGMGKPGAKRGDEVGTVFKMGERTYRIRAQVVVEEVGIEAETPSNEVRQRSDGSFEMLLSVEDATSIDKSERAVLETALPAVRAALSQHLSAVSKKKPTRP